MSQAPLDSTWQRCTTMQEGEPVRSTGGYGMYPRYTVRWFAAEMENKLRENDWKGGWRPPGNVDKHSALLALIGRLEDEVAELKCELTRATLDVDATTREAADVGNFAMMIADVAQYCR